jgi:hypothetical protein
MAISTLFTNVDTGELIGCTLTKKMLPVWLWYPETVELNKEEEK